MTSRCIVCARPGATQTMCPACVRSFNRHNRADMTTLGLIRWAANRARRFTRLDDLIAHVGGPPEEVDLPAEAQRVLFAEDDQS